MARVVPLRDDAALPLLRSASDQILPCDHNAFLLLGASKEYEPLHFDAFLSRLRFGSRDWIDRDELDATRWLQRAHGVAKFTHSHAKNAAMGLAYSRTIDSLQEFVNGLPAWDGTQRVAHAFTDAWGAEDSPLMRACSQNFFVAMIARALQPGAQVDTLWAFEGPQGIMKSKALRTLGGNFHAEISAQIGTADFQRELLGLWIAELSELDALRGKESSTIKRLLSAPADRFVNKWATHAESHPRRAVAVATTNEANYWQDPTGARRLVPVKCGEIRCDMIADNRLQWFAEARKLHADGATWWDFTGEIVDAQEKRQQADPWEDLIRDFAVNGREAGVGIFREHVKWPMRIASSVILREWLQIDAAHQTTMFASRLGKVMSKLGFLPVRFGHDRARGWEMPRSLQPPDETESQPASPPAAKPAASKGVPFASVPFNNP